MRARILSVGLFLVLALCAGSCVTTPLPAAQGTLATAPAVAGDQLPTPPPPPPPLVETMVPPPLVETDPVLAFGAQGSALTETLNTTLNMLSQARAENEKLQETAAELRQQLQDKSSAVNQLQAQLQAGDEKVQELEAALRMWQADVLGFRDEMRQAEEAELEVLQQIVTLLQTFKKEKGIE